MDIKHWTLWYCNIFLGSEWLFSSIITPWVWVLSVSILLASLTIKCCLLLVIQAPRPAHWNTAENLFMNLMKWTEDPHGFLSERSVFIRDESHLKVSRTITWPIKSSAYHQLTSLFLCDSLSLIELIRLQQLEDITGGKWDEKTCSEY